MHVSLSMLLVCMHALTRHPDPYTRVCIVACMLPKAPCTLIVYAQSLKYLYSGPLYGLSIYCNGTGSLWN